MVVKAAEANYTTRGGDASQGAAQTPTSVSGAHAAGEAGAFWLGQSKGVGRDSSHSRLQSQQWAMVLPREIKSSNIGRKSYVTFCSFYGY